VEAGRAGAPRRRMAAPLELGGVAATARAEPQATTNASIAANRPGSHHARMHPPDGWERRSDEGTGSDASVASLGRVCRAGPRVVAGRLMSSPPRPQGARVCSDAACFVARVPHPRAMRCASSARASRGAAVVPRPSSGTEVLHRSAGVLLEVRDYCGEIQVSAGETPIHGRPARNALPVHSHGGRGVNIRCVVRVRGARCMRPAAPRDAVRPRG
jgi:hypothetical protein